jgi:hypothetical protein
MAFPVGYRSGTMRRDAASSRVRRSMAGWALAPVVALVCAGCMGGDPRTDPVDIVVYNLCDDAVLALADLADDESGWDVQPGLTPVPSGEYSEYTIPVDFGRDGSDLYVWVVDADATTWGTDPFKLSRDALSDPGDGSSRVLTVSNEMCP